MLKLCRVDLEHREDLYQELKEFVKLLKERFPIKAIYLFGSFANGDIHEGSDIDLLIIGEFQGRFMERIGEITSLTDLPIEPLVYTPLEIEEMISNDNPFIKSLLETGKKI